MKSKGHVHSLVIAIIIALLVGLIVASVMTFLDWRLNPAGIFRGDSGTNWARVAETAGSWFFPTATVAAIVTVPLMLLLSFLAQRRGDPK